MSELLAAVARPGADGDSVRSSVALRQRAVAVGPRAHRTIARIIDATRDVFLTRGYSGTTIDEIARISNVSRASFYTYFPSKRDVLLAVGALAATECQDMIDRLANSVETRAALTSWVSEYFDLLDVHGGFAFAWTQAASDDADIRTAGMKRHLELCKNFGRALSSAVGRANRRPATLGLVAFSMLERGWNYAQLYTDTIDRRDLVREIAGALWASARESGAAKS
jgi:TetR/AcrR family transcriptional regulator